jgi:NifU-like protein involved in Fe-S cluster formation
LEREDGRAELRSTTCGSRVEVAVAVEDGRVQAVTQKVHACAFGQASAALMERGALGRRRADAAQALDQLGDWLTGGGAEPNWPGISALAPARSRKSRHAAILLPFRALLAALDAAS